MHPLCKMHFNWILKCQKNSNKIFGCTYEYSIFAYKSLMKKKHFFCGRCKKTKKLFGTKSFWNTGYLSFLHRLQKMSLLCNISTYNVHMHTRNFCLFFLTFWNSIFHTGSIWSYDPKLISVHDTGTLRCRSTCKKYQNQGDGVLSPENVWLRF